MTLLLKEAEVQSLLTMKDTIDVLEQAFKAWGSGRAINHPRQRIRVPNGFMHFMTAASLDHNLMGFKTYAVVNGKATFTVQVFDTETSQVVGLIEADAMGQIRTGAASGLAAKYLAKPDSKIACVIGSGYQAETQLEAVYNSCHIEKVFVFSRKPENRNRFAQTMSDKLDIEVTPVEAVDQGVEASDIVITVTTARTPVFSGSALKPGTCVLAAGSNHWMRQELDKDTFARADLITVDDFEQSKIECGELMAAVQAGVVRWEQVRELRDVVSGTIPGRPSEDAITLFESQGIALEDVAVAAHLLKLAKQQGVGQQMEFGQSQ